MKFNGILLAAALGGLIAACSSEDSSGSAPVGEKTLSINGFSQKGPVLVGSSVMVQELEDKTLLQTGKSFKGKILNDSGEFTIENMTLLSPYVLLEVNGYFRNEVTGKNSNGPVFMKALADISEQEHVNVNLLTHLEFERVQVLLGQKEMSIAEAKRQADQEIISAFFDNIDYEKVENLNIFGKNEGDAALLAINVLLLGKGQEAVFMENFAKLGEDLAADGVWSDSLLKAQIADEACEMDLAGKLSSIRKNIEAWKIADSIVAFEPYVTAFWEKIYGFEKCDNSNLGQRKKNSYKPSIFYGTEFTCEESGHWNADEKAVLAGCDSCGFMEDSRDGREYRTVRIGGVNWIAEDVDGDNGCPDGWKMPNRGDYIRLMEATSSNGYRDLFVETGWNLHLDHEGEIVSYWTSSKGYLGENMGSYIFEVGGAVDSPHVDLTVYLPVMPRTISLRCVEKGPEMEILSPSAVVADSFVDARDGKTYRTLKFEEQVWMAQNLEYMVDDSISESDNGGRYTWQEALEACPEGWRVPSRADVEQLLEYVGGGEGSAPLLTSRLDGSQDIYGFSALPTKMRSGGCTLAIGCASVSYAAEFWIADTVAGKTYGWTLDEFDITIEPKNADKLPVRCVKD